MARIRTIKPEFFRHEKLQALGPIPMLVFAGLWTQCDKAGNFQWRPAQLKLDILPFIDFDIGSTLEVLRKSGEVLQYFGDDSKEYGHIPTFTQHQRFFGSEIKSSPRFPAFLEEKQCLELPRNFQGTSKEATRIVELGVRSKELGVIASASPRVPDPIWDAVSICFYPNGIPSEYRSRVGKAVKALKEMKAKPEEIPGKFQAMRLEDWGKNAGVGPFVNNWNTLIPVKPKQLSPEQKMLLDFNLDGSPKVKNDSRPAF